MQVTSPDRRSVTTVARRAQIVAATIEVLAEVGYRDTSFARIAKVAGLSSTRLISYHFAGKDDLIAAVAAQVVEQMAEEVGGRVQAAPDAAARLTAYIEGVVQFSTAHRGSVRALLEIFLAGGLDSNAESVRGSAGPVEAILRDGQAAGQFRGDFDPRVIATAVQRAVEGAVFALSAEPELDSAGYARELVTLFRLGTAAGAGAS